MSDIRVVLVDENDVELGLLEKLEAHRKGLLHRAVSVFLINTKGEWIIQRRALSKYHSVGLWTNTCCTHPLPNEGNEHAAKRRLQEEMGMECDITEVFSFIYKENIDNDLIEHELDHVFVGVTSSIPNPNPDEVCDWQTIAFSDLQLDIEQHPLAYTVWFRKVYERVNSYLMNSNFVKN